MIRERLRRVWGAVGLGGIRLARQPRRTTLAVVGVGLAVLAVTLFASVGLGVAATGEEKFDQSGRDLWVTGGPLEIRAQETAPLENSLLGAHEVAAGIREREDVTVVTPMAFQAVYIGANASDLRLTTGVGVPRAPAGAAVSVDNGEGLEREDVHYANGSYDGPMTRNVLLDPATADRLGVSVGDTIHVGASQAGAREREFTVVGVSPTPSFSSMAHHGSKLACLSSHSDFSMLRIEIGMPSNEYSKSSNAEPSSLPRTSATILLTLPKHGYRPSPTTGIS